MTYAVLSARLGTGKGGLKEASAELRDSILHTTSDCIPLASLMAINGGVNMAVFVDQHLESKTSVCICAVEGIGSISMSCAELCTVLKNSGLKVAYIDLESDPKIDKDNPPDLREIAESLQGLDPEALPESKQSEEPKKGKQSKKTDKKATEGTQGQKFSQPPEALDVDTITNTLLETMHITSLVHEDEERRRIRADIVMRLNALRNAAYTTGFTAGRVSSTR